MTTTTQSDNTTKTDSKSIRIREDAWEAIREAAHQGKTSKVKVLDDILRAHYGLPPVSDSDETADSNAA